MKRVSFSLRRVGLIAAVTLQEAARQKLVAMLGLIAVGLVTGVHALRDFNFGASELKFIADFGVGIELGLAVEIAYMRTVGAFSVDNSEELVLSAKGRYLLVAMMREFFVGVNNLRDQARSGISTAEKELLFGDGEACDAGCK